MAAFYADLVERTNRLVINQPKFSNSDSWGKADDRECADDSTGGKVVERAERL